MNKTKIVATLGPESQSVEQITDLIKAGMNVARINLSHGNAESYKVLINNVKTARLNVHADTAILLDTRGPEVRVKGLEQSIFLDVGQDLIITAKPETSTRSTISTNYPNLVNDIRIDDLILMDDGKLTVKVVDIKNEEIITTVTVGGMLADRKRVAIPGIEINLPSLSAKDETDIAFGVEQDVDFIAASFVRQENDVWAVRKIIEDNGGDQAIIAKIENRQGVNNLDEILSAADGVMVARGDLGVEVPAEEVPIIQKHMIKSANAIGKPVITATQMLESMIHSPSPTRAEASDVANAIYDGTDAVMLSGETAVGKFPIEAVNFLVRCAEISENSLNYKAILAEGLKHRRPTITDSISYASCATAADLSAAAIITATTSGSTSRMVARYRPMAPVIAISPSPSTIRHLQLIRGVMPLLCSFGSSMDEQLDRAIHAATQAKLIHNGDLVVITAGMPLGSTGTTNMLKVHTVADICVTGQGIGSSQAMGSIRIIEKESDWENLPKDAIVVVSSTDESMIDYLVNVNGIIAEAAGLTSHAAIVGRELGIPVVCNVSSALMLFENDQQITIDGTNGHICYGRSNQNI
ncbi:MAG: pyruvate kinase [Desulfotalea sp.]